MTRRGLWVLLTWLSLSQIVRAAPDQTMSITPTCTAGTTITCSDETTRNTNISTPFNAHSHTDLSQSGNTFNVGDGTAGNKSICANAADGTDRCLRWDDTNDLWVMDQSSPATFNTVVTHSSQAELTANALMVGAGPGLIDDLILLAGSRPSTYGDVSARVRNTAALSVASGTATVLTFDTERWDTDTIHSTSTNTGRLTATTAGKYQITGHVQWAAGAVGFRRLEILLNGTTVIASQELVAQNTDHTPRLSISTHYDLAAAEYVELRAYQESTPTLNVTVNTNYSPEFEMVKVP